MLLQQHLLSRVSLPSHHLRTAHPFVLSRLPHPFIPSSDRSWCEYTHTHTRLTQTCKNSKKKPTHLRNWTHARVSAICPRINKWEGVFLQPPHSKHTQKCTFIYTCSHLHTRTPSSFSPQAGADVSCQCAQASNNQPVIFSYFTIHLILIYGVRNTNTHTNAHRASNI